MGVHENRGRGVWEAGKVRVGGKIVNRVGSGRNRGKLYNNT